MEPLPWVCVTRHPGSVQSVESGICHGVWLFQNNGRIVGKREGQGGNQARALFTGQWTTSLGLINSFRAAQA